MVTMVTTVALWALVLINVGMATASGQHCYECSSKSSRCRSSVYEGRYLSTTLCNTQCFYRNERNRIYRGCFDGWQGGIVQNNYIGCRTQIYLGNSVEWCFCNRTSNAKTSLPCNGADRDTIARLARGQNNVQRDNDGTNMDKDERRDALHHRIKYSGLRRPEGRALTQHYLGSHRRLYHESDLANTYEDEEATMRPIVGMCHRLYDGIYADPYDCTRFVHCFNAFTYRRLCPPGTVWNSETKNCDFPHKTALSNCNPRQYRPMYVTSEDTSMNTHLKKDV